jgi:hypothetical protein
MRWIVVSLALLNIGAFVYFQLFANKSSSGLSAVSIGSPVVDSDKAIVLLSEVVVTDKVESIRVASPKPLSSPSTVRRGLVSGEPLCTLVGAFKRLLKAEYFVERLLSWGLSAQVKNLVVNSQSGYWLHLPPEKSRKDALRRLSELQSRGIDSYVIPSGSLANGISLGMFSNQERADAMLVNVSAQGYKPKIVSVPREQKEVWAFLSQGEAAKLSDERWAELLSTEEYIQKRQILCSDVASY